MNLVLLLLGTIGKKLLEEIAKRLAAGIATKEINLKALIDETLTANEKRKLRREIALAKAKGTQKRTPV